MKRKEKNERRKQKRRETKRKHILKLQKLRGKTMGNRKQVSSSAEALRAHEEILVDAIQAEKWMVAVWKVQDGKIVFSGRTTWEFPKADLIAAAGLLKDDCQSEVDESPVTAFGTPLPRAHSVCEPEGRIPFGVINTDNKPEEPSVELVDAINLEEGISGNPPIQNELPLDKDEFERVFGKVQDSTVLNEMPGIRAYPEEAKKNKPVLGDNFPNGGSEHE